MLHQSFHFIYYLHFFYKIRKKIQSWSFVLLDENLCFFEKISTQDYLGLQSDEFLIKVDFSLKSKKSSITSLQYFSITLPTVVLGIVAKIK